MDHEAFRIAVIEEFSKRSGIEVSRSLLDLQDLADSAGQVSNFSGIGGAYYDGLLALNGYQEDERIFYMPHNVQAYLADSEAYNTATLFHEIAHATKVEHRLNRRFPRFCYKASEEVVAELTAMKLADMFGISDNESKNLHLKYISIWADDLDQNMLKELEELSDIVVDYILVNWLPDLAAQYQAKEAI